MKKASEAARNIVAAVLGSTMILAGAAAITTKVAAMVVTAKTVLSEATACESDELNLLHGDLANDAGVGVNRITGIICDKFNDKFYAGIQFKEAFETTTMSYGLGRSSVFRYCDYVSIYEISKEDYINHVNASAKKYNGSQLPSETLRFVKTVTQSYDPITVIKLENGNLADIGPIIAELNSEPER